MARLCIFTDFRFLLNVKLAKITYNSQLCPILCINQGKCGQIGHFHNFSFSSDIRSSANIFRTVSDFVAQTIADPRKILPGLLQSHLYWNWIFVLILIHESTHFRQNMSISLHVFIRESGMWLGKFYFANSQIFCKDNLRTGKFFGWRHLSYELIEKNPKTQNTCINCEFFDRIMYIFPKPHANSYMRVCCVGSPEKFLQKSETNQKKSCSEKLTHLMSNVKMSRKW